MHQDIQKFYLSGTITAGNFLQTRDRLINRIENDMRVEGFVPVLDLIPHFTREYDEERENFTFELSIYGVYVGEDEACLVSGIMNGQPILKHMHPAK